MVCTSQTLVQSINYKRPDGASTLYIEVESTGVVGTTYTMHAYFI